jgi:hypothetical protein
MEVFVPSKIAITIWNFFGIKIHPYKIGSPHMVELWKQRQFLQLEENLENDDGK